MYAQVIIDIAVEQVDRTFVYRIPENMHLERGMRVEVPFGNGIKEGYVIEITESAGFDESKIRNVLATLEDYPVLLPELMDLANEVKAKYHCTLCDALRLLIPAQMRKGRIKAKMEPFVRLLVSAEKAEELAAQQKRSKKRQLFLRMISDGKDHAFSELSVVMQGVPEIVRYFEEQGTVFSGTREILRTPMGISSFSSPEHVLTEEQKEVIDEIVPALQKKENRVFLLHGVTGSGKTEVYIRLVKYVLSMGGSAIILVPEIVLTPQMTDWFRSRFGENSAVLHSRLSQGERFDEWRRIRRGDARIVIGARSAVFAPLQDVRLIVVDEEHEQSYISEHTPQYDAREIAIMRMRRAGGSVLLASATPSVYSYAMARKGDYTLLEMPTRANGKPLPAVRIVDMRKELEQGNKDIFSLELLVSLKKCIEDGQQAILFLNRRGYASSVKCRHCGNSIKCPNCDVSMAYHVTDDKLHCHYCGTVQEVPSVCPDCESKYIRPMGIGTQKVEEALKKHFPDVSVLRMDLDTTSAQNSYIEILNAFRTGKAQVLIGTQMIAKGLDFPRVTLVGAIMADMTLDLPDYRSPERTYQLLVQVAGRAGRAGEEGNVIIQSYKPEHYAIASALKQDYRQFFNEEFARRRKDLYPPFTAIIRILCESDTGMLASQTAIKVKEEIDRFVEKNPKLKKRLLFIKCDKAPIGKIQNKFRMQVLMKILVHEDSELLKAFCADLPLKDWPCSVYCEMNPSSLA